MVTEAPDGGSEGAEAEEVTQAEEVGRGRWSTAIGLALAVLILAVFDALALVLLPLAILLVALPGERRAGWVVAGGAMWMAALLLSGGVLAMLSRGWGLMLGAIFLSATLMRPRWDVTSRALASAGIAVALGALGLLLSGQVADLDALVRAHFGVVSTAFVELQARLPESARVANLDLAAAQMADLQTEVFPAVVALQSVAALALVAWWVRRLGRSKSESFALARMRDFRFNDQLIWILIGALVLMLLPLDGLAARLALNVLVFMGALYALRGLAVFTYLATGSRSIPTMVLGAIVLVMLYPVVFTAALLMGVGDTWLDVRRRIPGPAPA